MDDLSPQHPVLLSRAKACRMLGISTKEFFALVQAGKLHPLTTSGRHTKVPVAEIIALKAELVHRALVMPYERLVMASAFFASNAVEVNQALSDLGCPRAPVEYIERLRMSARQEQDPGIIRADSYDGFLAALGRSYEIIKRDDIRLIVETLHMMNRGEEEIRQIIRAKFGREYTKEEVSRFLEYFWNWKIMDHESALFYLETLQGRARTVKECAYKRSDYFVYYALGIDYGGEVSDLLERSCLGLLYKFNIMVESYVYGTAMVSQQDLLKSAELIQTLLSASRDVRGGKMPRDKAEKVVESAMVPHSITRAEFFSNEKATSFSAPKLPG